MLKKYMNPYHRLFDLRDVRNHDTTSIRLSLERYGTKTTRRHLRDSLRYEAERLRDDMIDCGKIIRGKRFFGEEEKQRLLKLVKSYNNEKKILENILEKIRDEKDFWYKGVHVSSNHVKQPKAK